MAHLRTTTGEMVMMDDSDVILFAGCNLYYHTKTGVKVRICHKLQSARRVLMHPTDNEIVIVKDYNPLNLRRSNLENVLWSVARHHTRYDPAKRTSKYRGVVLRKGRNLKKPWSAMLACALIGDGDRAGGSHRQFRLGEFATEEEAARAYDKAALAWYGKLAMLNFPKTGA